MWSLKAKKQKKEGFSFELAITLTRGCLTACMTSLASAMLMFKSME